jgi:hypothetical protein
MSAAEQAEWTAGNRDFVHRLRVAMGPSVILVANNVWANGNPDLNGITVEHHSFSEASHWSAMLGRPDWFKPTRNMVIANSASEAQSWAGVEGVTHVSAQSAYGGPAAPVVSFSLLPGALSGPLAPGGSPAPGGDPPVPGDSPAPGGSDAPGAGPSDPAPTSDPSAPAPPVVVPTPASPEASAPAPVVRRRSFPFVTPQ